MSPKNSPKNKPSRGLGDTIAKLTEATGIAHVVEKVSDALGIEDCGCGKRQEVLNQWFPYQPSDDTTRIVERDGEQIQLFD